MGFFSALKKVAKVAALPVTAPLKLQAKIGSRALSMVARAVPMPGSSSARALAAPAAMRGSPALPSGFGWRGSAPASTGEAPAPTQAQQAWFPQIAAAVTNVQQAPAPTSYGAYPYGPAPAPLSPYAPAPAPAPAPALAPAATWSAPPSPPPSWGGGYSGGGGGAPYSGGGGGYDSGDSDLQPDDYPSESTDEEQLGDEDATAIDYRSFLADGDGAGGLGDWKSGLLSVVKGAASGALSATAGALTPKPSAAALAAARPAGMSMGAKVAIGAAVVVPLAYLALRRGQPARAHNPGRRRRRRRTSRR